MDLGPHSLFIWLSYGAVATVIFGLVLGLWLDGRRHARDLALLEARGLGRGGTGADGSSAG